MDIRCEAGGIRRVGVGGGAVRMMIGRARRMRVGGGAARIGVSAHSAEGIEVGDGVAGGIIKINKNFFSFFVPAADLVGVRC